MNGKLCQFSRHVVRTDTIANRQTCTLLVLTSTGTVPTRYGYWFLYPQTVPQNSSTEQD
jgi:hypothetical protein